jgi:hypothetical protein
MCVGMVVVVVVVCVCVGGGSMCGVRACVVCVCVWGWRRNVCEFLFLGGSGQVVSACASL